MRLFRASIWCSSEGGGTREAGRTVAGSLVRRSSTCNRTAARFIGRVSTRFGEGGGELDRRRARGVLNPCARESKERTGRLLREKLISDQGQFFSYEDQQRAANRKYSWGFFQACTGLGAAGCRLARRLYELKASTAIFFFPISLIADGPQRCHPACGHNGSSHLSPVHALRFFIVMQVQHSYNSSTNG